MACSIDNIESKSIILSHPSFKTASEIMRMARSTATSTSIITQRVGVSNDSKDSNDSNESSDSNDSNDSNDMNESNASNDSNYKPKKDSSHCG